MQGKEYNQHKRKQTLPERMFATTGASQARSPMTMGATQRFAAVMFVFVFLASGVYFLHPFSIDNSYAETATSSASAEMSVNLDPTITIWTTDTSDSPITAANIAASPDESVATTAVRAHVSTNNLTGYTLTIQSNSTDAKMKHENTSVTKTIDPITGSGTSSSSWAGNSSLNNMWGYSIGTNDSFVGVPGSSSSATTIDSTDAPNNDNYTDITFATKANLSLPAGTYTDTVIFSAVANAIPNTLKMAADKAGITTMQGLTQDVCAAADIYQSGEEDLTLTDTRDNLSYTVRKLADGKCWMAQNFRMTKDTLTAAGHSAKLDSSDTNLSGTTTYAMPNNASWQSTSATAEGAADATLLPKGSKTGPKASGTEALAHGAYYSWATAVANKNTIGTGSKQTTSICPKGWKLPDSDGSTSASTNQLQALYNKYNSATSFNQAFNTYYNSSDATNYLAGLWYSDSNQYVGNVGTGGYWWSSTSHSSRANCAWYLSAVTSSIFPADYYTRYNGVSMRCVLGS